MKKEGKREGRDRNKETKMFQIILNDMELSPFKKRLLQKLPN